MKNNDLKIMIITTTIFIIIAVCFQKASDALKNRTEPSQIHQLFNQFSK